MTDKPEVLLVEQRSSVDVQTESAAFRTWVSNWLPGQKISTTSHLFDAWLASARHRISSQARPDGELAELVERLRTTKLLSQRNQLALQAEAANAIERLSSERIAEPFPQPQRKDGGEPCGECRLQPGERCDICGAKANG